MLELFKNADILSVSERKTLYLLKFNYNAVVMNSNLKSMIEVYMQRVTDSAKSRKGLRFEVPRMNSTAEQKSPHYLAIMQWNKLPDSIKKAEKIIEFDSALRQYLILQRNDIFA